MPSADFVMIQARLPLRLLEALLAGPTGRGDVGQLRQWHVPRGIGQVVGDLIGIAHRTPCQQPDRFSGQALLGLHDPLGRPVVHARTLLPLGHLQPLPTAGRPTGHHFPHRRRRRRLGCQALSRPRPTAGFAPRLLHPGPPPPYGRALPVPGGMGRPGPVDAAGYGQALAPGRLQALLALEVTEAWKTTHLGGNAGSDS